jgi:hypothetical protein
VRARAAVGLAGLAAAAVGVGASSASASAAASASASPSAAAGAAGAPPARVATALDVAVGPANAAYGTLHTAEGRMRTDDGMPLVARRISLQVRPYPFTGRWHAVDHATTDKHGAFAFDDLELDRNADVRVVAFDGTTSGIARAFTYPAFRKRFKSLGHRRIRITQTYRTPPDVRLRRSTLFYVGSGTAVSATVTKRGSTRRVRPGRFESTVTVRLPRAFRGNFRYATCFKYTKGSGMGDPALGCPDRYTF